MRKKKYPRLPNGYGQIRKLSGNRRNPFGVYPPQIEEDPDGRKLPVKALCYVPTWTVAFAVLTAYKAGRYVPGMEHDIIAEQELNALETPYTGILSDYARIRRTMLNIPEEFTPTFSDVFKMYYRDKFETGKTYSKQMQNSIMAGFKNCASLHDRIFRELRVDDLQAVVDSCTLKHSSVILIVLVIKQMYKYADAHELCNKDYGRFVSVKRGNDDEHGVPFSPEELQTLWANADDPTVEMILIMCYAGYRIAAYKNMSVNLKERYFLGGNKTESGKGLQTPIHSATLPLVSRRLQRDGILLASDQLFRKRMYATLEKLGLEKHTPHDCKHTFSALCEKYGVNENDRKRLLGHKVGNLTNDIYGHRTLDDLRQEIEKIKAPDLSKACQKRV